MGAKLFHTLQALVDIIYLANLPALLNERTEILEPLLTHVQFAVPYRKDFNGLH